MRICGSGSGWDASCSWGTGGMKSEASVAALEEQGLGYLMAV